MRLTVFLNRQKTSYIIFRFDFAFEQVMLVKELYSFYHVIQLQSLLFGVHTFVLFHRSLIEICAHVAHCQLFREFLIITILVIGALTLLNWFILNNKNIDIILSILHGLVRVSIFFLIAVDVKFIYFHLIGVHILRLENGFFLQRQAVQEVCICLDWLALYQSCFIALFIQSLRL